MSVSELFDHGQPHPWANLRMNNETIDGTLTSSNISNKTILTTPFSLNIGFGNTPLYFKGTGNVQSTPAAPTALFTVLNFNPLVNSVVYIVFTINGFINAAGSFGNNIAYQKAEFEIKFLGGVLSFIGGNPRAGFNDFVLLPFPPGTGGELVALGINTVTISAYDNNVGDIVNWECSVEIWSTNQP